MSAVLEEVIECYCPEMTVVHNQKLKKWIYVLAKKEMIYVSQWADICQSQEKRAGWSSLWELTGKKCGLCLRHPGAGMRLVGLFKEHGWERIMLFAILQNEKEKRKKDVTTHQSLKSFDYPLARISNFLHFLLCEIQLRICQTKTEYLFWSHVKDAFYISLGKIAFPRKSTVI